MRVKNTVQKSVVGIALLFVGVAITGNISMFVSNLPMSFFVAGFFGVFAWGFLQILKKESITYRWWLVIIFVLALGCRLFMLVFWKIEPESDFKSTYDAALAIGTNISAQNPLLRPEYEYYYTKWSVHVPFIVIKALIIRIFGRSYIPIQIVFNVFASLSCVLTAEISKEIYKDKRGVAAGLLLAVLPPLLFCSPLLTNQHIATFFFLLSIYLLIKMPLKRKWENIIFASLFCALSNLIRPEMLVFVIAVICYILYKEIFCLLKTQYVVTMLRRIVVFSSVFLVVYFSLMYSVNAIMIKRKIIKNDITRTNYRYKIATGLNRDSGGKWNEEDSAYIDDDVMLDVFIKERTQKRGELCLFMAKKLMYQFGTYDYWCAERAVNDFDRRVYSAFANASMLIILFLCLTRLFCMFSDAKDGEILLAITLIGFFMVFSVIEVQNRYNYLVIPLFTILGNGALIMKTKLPNSLANSIKGNKKAAS